MNQHDRIIADWRAEQQAERGVRQAARHWPVPFGPWRAGRLLRNPGASGASGAGPNNYRPLIKGGQGRSARSVYSEAMMAAYAVGAISAIILAGWLLTAAIGGPQ